MVLGGAGRWQYKDEIWSKVKLNTFFYSKTTKHFTDAILEQLYFIN